MRKQPSNAEMASHAGAAPRGVSRRTFLQAATAGAGALALGGCGETTQAASKSAPVAMQTAPPAPDFTKMAEDWNEPWEWRPGDWPRDQLQLNVVPHAAPMAIFSDNLQPGVQLSLFSYGGISPGPTIRMKGDETLFIKVRNLLPANDKPCVPEHSEGPHQQHTTNLHTHGLHIQPGRNRDGSVADNVLLRIIPSDDYDNRRATQNPECWPLSGNEVVGEASFEFRLGSEGEIHPPGTFWYHPHPHGATFDQVASGMAGFLIIEGDVDKALKEWNPTLKERLMLMMRVHATFRNPLVEQEPFKNKEGVVIPKPPTAVHVVNGQADPNVIVMQPGAWERWRVLNGSVDGQGYVEFMVIEGYYPDQAALADALAKAVADPTIRQQLDHLAFDGITLITNDPVNPQYTTRPVKSLVLAPANRADFLFQAPPLVVPNTPQVYTVVGAYYPDASDEAQLLQQGGNKLPGSLNIATLIVREAKDDKGNPLPSPAIDLTTLAFPPMLKMLYPITEDELIIPEAEAQARGEPNEAGLLRTRQVIYSGWGNPLVSDGKNGVKPDPDNPQSLGRLMAIDGQQFDADVVGHKMLLGSAEEWSVWNCSLTLWDNDYTKTSGTKITTKAVDHPFHIHINPFWIIAIEDNDGNPLDHDGSPLPSAADFQPRWQDTIRLPRNGGRVVFRSRFWDYAGRFVNHCHILVHEDHGMMQQIEVVDEPEAADYVAQEPGYAWPPMTREECYERNLAGGGDSHH